MIPDIFSEPSGKPNWLMDLIREHFPSLLKCEIRLQQPHDTVTHSVDFIFHRRDHDLYMKFSISSQVFMGPDKQKVMEQIQQIMMMELRNVDEQLGQLPTHDELYEELMGAVHALYDKENFIIACNGSGFKMIIELMQGKQLYMHPEFSERSEGKTIYKFYGIDIILDHKYEALKFPFYALQRRKKQPDKNFELKPRPFRMDVQHGFLKVEVKKSFVEELEQALMDFNKELDAGNLSGEKAEEEVKKLRTQVNSYTELLSYKMQDATKAIMMLEKKARGNNGDRGNTEHGS